MIDYQNIESIQENGFKGFHRIKNLYHNIDLIPKEQGIYLVLFNTHNQPEFASTGTGGHFKGRNPNISITELKSNWVENTKVIYIGKAGGTGSSATLHSRIKQYLRFGGGSPVGHWGGRLIWQIKKYDDLIICWKPLPNHDPRTIEKSLIQDFLSQYGKRPFANLTG